MFLVEAVTVWEYFLVSVAQCRLTTAITLFWKHNIQSKETLFFQMEILISFVSSIPYLLEEQEDSTHRFDQVIVIRSWMKYRTSILWKSPAFQNIFIFETILQTNIKHWQWKINKEFQEITRSYDFPKIKWCTQLIQESESPRIRASTGNMWSRMSNKLNLEGPFWIFKA